MARIEARRLITLVLVSCFWATTLTGAVRCGRQDPDPEVMTRVRDATPRERRNVDPAVLEHLLERVASLEIRTGDQLPIELVRAEPAEFRGRKFGVAGRRAGHCGIWRATRSSSAQRS